MKSKHLVELSENIDPEILKAVIEKGLSKRIKITAEVTKVWTTHLPKDCLTEIYQGDIG